MPNQIDSTGLQIKTSSEILSELESSFRIIYGDDINLDSNSPDGQALNILTQAIIDNLELLVDVYNSFDLYSAYGTTLDSRGSLLGIERNGGTYTMVSVEITVTKALTLQGLDLQLYDPYATAFTITDDNGNRYYLATSVVFAIAGTQSFDFRAQYPGALNPNAGTLTNIITVTDGVQSVNNPAVADQIGTDEESDAQYRTRIQKSSLVQATGPADSVAAALLKIENCSDAIVIENDTSGTVDSIPANSLWCIVNGGSDDDIAAAIYAKKSAGCGLYGSESVVYNRVNGGTKTIAFDRAIAQDLYIDFSYVPKYSGQTFDEDYIKETLATNLMYKLGQKPTIADVIVALNTIEPDLIVTAATISDDGITYAQTPLDPTDHQHYFFLSVGDITIT